MGKSRDELLWQLGKKPSDKSDKEAYRDHLSRQAKEGHLTEAAELALKNLETKQACKNLPKEESTPSED